jgi:hypothetical protein
MNGYAFLCNSLQDIFDTRIAVTIIKFYLSGAIFSKLQFRLPKNCLTQIGIELLLFFSVLYAGL